MGRLFSLTIGEDRGRAALPTMASDRNEELVQGHARVDRDDAPRVGFRALELSHSSRGELLDEGHEAFDAHGCGLCCFGACGAFGSAVLDLARALTWRRGGGVRGAAVLAAAPDSASRAGGTSVELCEVESA